MNEFFKKNIISIAILILGLGLLFSATYKNEPKPDFTITTQEMLQVLKDTEYVYKLETQTGLADNNKYAFVDLRNAYDFEISHIENALNIPTAFLLDSEYSALYDEIINSGKTIVLYGQTQRDAVSPWFLMYELGFTGTKILSGGYDCYLEKSNKCEPEVARYNYAEIASQGGIKEIKVIKKKPPVKKKKTIPVQKKVKVEEEGGC